MLVPWHLPAAPSPPLSLSCSGLFSVCFLILLINATASSAMSTMESAAEREMTATAAATAAAKTYSSSSSPTNSDQTSVQPRSRRKRSLVFPTGSDLSFDVGLSIPIAALSATSECLLNDKCVTYITRNARIMKTTQQTKHAETHASRTVVVADAVVARFVGSD